MFKYLGMLNTYWPLIAPALIGTSPFYVLLFYWGFRRLPSELFEAARLEGMSPLRDLAARGDAARPPRHDRGGRARFRRDLGQLPRPADLHLRRARCSRCRSDLRSLAVVDRTGLPVATGGRSGRDGADPDRVLYLQRYFLQQYHGAGWLVADTDEGGDL